MIDQNSDQAMGDTFVLLDDNSDPNGQSLLFRDPLAIIEATGPDEVGPACRALAEALEDGKFAAGFLSYELGYALESRLAPAMPEVRRVPLLWFAICETPLPLSGESAQQWMASASQGNYGLELLDVSLNEADYLGRFRRVQELLQAGDLYQMNLTLKQRFRWSGNSLALYRELRRRQNTSFGAYIRAPSFDVLSASPELFVRISDGVAESRPMKGTACRGKSEESDRKIREHLRADEKNRAENLMIVDLMRNDLGRIARVGSVEVPLLFEVESYATLHQMISVVRARLNENIGIGDLLSALFPAGSVTGAPKIHAMELIRQLEPEPRGVYTGAIGFFGPDGRVQLNVAIRTAVAFPDGSGEFGIGSGIVADSDGTGEYAECLLKMQILADASNDYQLIETIRYEREGGYWLLPEHMARLERSARTLGFWIDMSLVSTKLAEIVIGRPEPALRVRLLLSRNGNVEVTAAPLEIQKDQPILRYVISKKRVSSNDALLQHKTTLRELYDGEHEVLSKQLGIDEVVFLNERGEVTEGSRTNIFVERQGILMTPPLHSGALPGTLRARLLTDGRIVEQVIWPSDLATAEKVYLGNSVSGLLRAVEKPQNSD